MNGISWRADYFDLINSSETYRRSRNNGSISSDSWRAPINREIDEIKDMFKVLIDSLLGWELRSLLTPGNHKCLIFVTLIFRFWLADFGISNFL